MHDNVGFCEKKSCVCNRNYEPPSLSRFRGGTVLQKAGGVLAYAGATVVFSVLSVQRAARTAISNTDRPP